MDVEKFAEFVEKSTAAIEHGVALQREKTATQRAIAERVPGVVQALVSRGYVAVDLTEKLAETLHDPASALDFLQRVVTDGPPRQTPARMGSGSGGGQIVDARRSVFFDGR